MRKVARRTAIGVAIAALSIIPTTAAHATLTTRHTAPLATPAVGLPSYETWIGDVTAVAEDASTWLEERLAKSPKGTAIVLDIDNTALESTYHGGGFGGTIPAIEPVLSVAQQADTFGAAVFFVTARDRSSGSSMRANLEAVGYPVTDIYFHDFTDGLSTAEYKTASRADIERRGYVIVANIGNNTTDLVGGHAEKTFKLPDYDMQLG